MNPEESYKKRKFESPESPEDLESPEDPGEPSRLQRSAKTLFRMYVHQADFGDILAEVKNAKGQTERIRCSSLVLASASAPIRCMLSGPMASPQASASLPMDQRVLRLDGEHGAFAETLKFLHGFQMLDWSLTTAMNTYKMADYYEILPLRSHCVEFLCAHVVDNPANVLDVLRWSESMHCPEVLARCLDVWALNFELVTEQPEFLQVDVDIMKQVFYRDCIVCEHEVTIFARLVDWAVFNISEKRARSQIVNLVTCIRRSACTEDALASRYPCLRASAEKLEQAIWLTKPRRHSAESWDLGDLHKQLGRFLADKERMSALFPGHGPGRGAGGFLVGDNPPTPAARVFCESDIAAWELRGKEPFVFGRGTTHGNANLPSGSPLTRFISKKHFEICFTDEYPKPGLAGTAHRVAWLVDYSRNGTMVNGVDTLKIAPTKLKNGDVITILTGIANPTMPLTDDGLVVLPPSFIYCASASEYMAA